VIAFTDDALEELAAAETAARRFDPNARIRLARDPNGGVGFALTDAPDPTDERVPAGGSTLYVERGLEGTVATGEHGTLTLLP
jgi:hypothetical protein